MCPNLETVDTRVASRKLNAARTDSKALKTPKYINVVGYRNRRTVKATVPTNN
jgi:hypothetical protein